MVGLAGGRPAHPALGRGRALVEGKGRSLPQGRRRQRRAACRELGSMAAPAKSDSAAMKTPATDKMTTADAKKAKNKAKEKKIAKTESMTKSGTTAKGPAAKTNTTAK